MHIILSFIFLFSSTFGLKTSVRLNHVYNVVIFGDSFTDTGNVYELTNYTWPITPPYYQGRVFKFTKMVVKYN
jgi:hypothetical protein